MWLTSLSRTEDKDLVLRPSSTLSTMCEVATTITNSITWSCVPQKGLNILYQLLTFAVPSFMRRTRGTSASIVSEKPHHRSPRKKSSTEYLDGVRGLASFIVFVLHWTHIQYPGVNTGYGVEEESSIWQLPIVRIVHSGAAMVSIFFVVSGYVLTHRFVQNMHRHEFESLYSGLTSLAFRRAIRLFLPALASVLLAYLCASLGLITIPKKVDDKQFHHGLLALITYFDDETNPWTWEVYMKGFYNPQLWSIALEFRGSLVIFLAVLALAKTKTLVRVVIEVAIIAHAFGHKRWDVSAFVAGMLIAETDIIVSSSPRRTLIVQKKHTKALLTISILVGVWFAGFPRDKGLKAFGYQFLRRTWPHSEYRRRFWMSIGAILVVMPMPFMPKVQAFFCNRIIRYLGRISFALYLIHGLGNRVVGRPLVHLTWELLGRNGYWQNATCYVVSSCLYLPVIIWCADMYWRAIDVPATQFAKWVEIKCAARPAI